MIYFYTSIFVVLLVVFECFSKPQVRKICFWIGAVIVLFLFGFRGINVGGDTEKYVDFYLNKGAYFYGTLNDNDLEIVFVYFCKLLHCISETPFMFIFGTSCLTLLPFFTVVYKYGTSKCIPLIYIFCFYYLIVCIETNIRQDVAVGLLICSFLVYEKDKTNVYYLTGSFVLLLLALFCHTSMYLIVPLFILALFVDLLKNKIVIYALIVSSYVIGTLTTQYFESLYYSLMWLLGDSDTFVSMTKYADSATFGLTGKSIAVSFQTMSLSIWTLFNIYNASSNELKNIFLKSMVIFCVLYNFTCSFPLAFRTFFLFELLSIVYVPVKLIRQKSMLVILCLWGAYWIRILYLMSITKSMQNADTMMFPYKFIFE